METGVVHDERLTMRMAPAWADVPERERAALLWRRIEDEIGALPGIVAAGAVRVPC